MKRHIILFLVFTLYCTSCSRKANVTDFSLPKNEEKPLVALGQLWGFLKYHHPAVAQGNYNWDAELIKMIPLVRESKDESQWKKLLDNWIDSLPPIPVNPDKKLPDSEIKMKPDYGELFNTDYFFPETINKIKFILDNAIITTNHYAKVDINQDRRLFITNELSYNDMLYPDLSYRLLALFRYWNIVNYFFPYRELCDQKWSDVLPEMLPEFVYDNNQEEYIFSCMKLAAKIDDSHAFIYPNLQAGVLKVPFETQFIENRLVITKFTGSTPIKENIEIGDIITVINGETVDDIVKKMLPYTCASNYAVKQREIAWGILTGNTATVTITVQRGKKTFEVKVPRYDKRLLNIPSYYFNPQPDKEGYTILDNNIGYVLPSNCKAEDSENGIKKVLDGTKGVIIDMRCYPNFHFTAQMFSSHFNSDSILVDKSGYTNVSYPGYVFMSKERYCAPNEWFYKNNKLPKNRYTQKVVVIVNEYTESQAESHTMVYQTAPNVVVIGSTTAGADGGVSNDFNLPGNIITRMTSYSVYYPDGSNLQRSGVKIDKIVKPTIAGIKAGRDELLERAIAIINESNH